MPLDASTHAEKQIAEASQSDDAGRRKRECLALDRAVKRARTRKRITAAKSVFILDEMLKLFGDGEHWVLKAGRGTTHSA